MVATLVIKSETVKMTTNVIIPTIDKNNLIIVSPFFGFAYGNRDGFAFFHFFIIHKGIGDLNGLISYFFIEIFHCVWIVLFGPCHGYSFFELLPNTFMASL
jgi:hypothetical protein